MNYSQYLRTTQSDAKLHVADYVVFGLFLLISTVIGLYFMWQERRQKRGSANDYLFGGRQLTAGPVAMSLTASFMSALTMLGWPSEFYLYGTMFCWFALTYLLVACITAVFFVPLFYNANVNSTYEYLEKRYQSPGLRMLTEIVYILNTCLYAGIVCYAPALAINAVLDVSLWGGVLITAGVCTFYTTLGGLKAVVWTDVFQSVIMVSGFLMIVIKGCTDFGFSEIWKINEEQGRIDFFRFSPDPTQRHTFWTIVVGGTAGIWLGTFGVNQTEVQRYLSCKTMRDAQLSIFIAVGNLWALIVLGCGSGLAMFAYYSVCDPLTATNVVGDGASATYTPWVAKSDQLIPYLVTDIFSPWPGLAGLYIASIYSGTLSTVSSGINSMATITLLDFIDPYFTFSKTVYRSFAMKGLVAFFGACCCLCAFLADQLGGVLEAAMSVNGIVFGPTLGLFIMAGYINFTNKYGAIVGYVSGISMGTWIYIGSKAYPPTIEHTNKLPTTIQGCTNHSSMRVPKAYVDPNYPGIAENWYALSYMYYSTMGLITCLVLGCLVSLFMNYIKKNDHGSVHGGSDKQSIE